MSHAPHVHTRRSALAFGGALTLTLMGGAAARAQGAMSAAGDRKLVVIVCRGAMDGLSVTVPVGDAAYAGLRGPLAIHREQALALDGDFGLHPKLKSLAALHGAGQARFAPAVAIPERVRSHFEAQDMLESGGARLYGATTGWLNRALGVQPAARRVKALSIGPQQPLILRGPVQAESWSPGGRVDADAGRVATALQELYKTDTLLGPALASGLAVEAQADALNGGAEVRAGDARAFAVTAAKFLTAPDGPAVAVLSLDGFDTHAGQGAAEGQLAQRLAVLDATVEGLHTGLGPAWDRTVVVVATEFGRTARVNGTGGTDHGTASTLLLAGGALKPGALVGDWPGLQEARLYENRDLAPTLDIRAVFKGVLRDHMGLDRRALDTAVFPDSAGVVGVDGLVRA